MGLRNSQDGLLCGAGELVSEWSKSRTEADRDGGVMFAGARLDSGGRVACSAHDHERARRSAANSGGIIVKKGLHVRRHRATPPLFVAMAMVLLRGAGADSVTEPNAGEIGGTGHQGLDRDRGDSLRGGDAEYVPWRAVPVEMKPTPRARRRDLSSDLTVLDASNAAEPTTATESTAEVAAADESAAHVTTSENSSSSDATETGPQATQMGGEFGIAADWRHGISMPGEDGNNASLRGEACLVEEKQAEVHEILRKRKTTPAESKVAVCVRSKDFGRFLPEWIAYHYAIGVDEIMLYDDDSVDDTKQVLQPFVDAGMVLYLFEEIGDMRNQMRPLNHCLDTYVERRERDSTAPAWILFHDTDEYIFPLQTDSTISQALMEHSAICCVQVPRVQYGTSGYRQMPRGLVLETFLAHASPYNSAANRIPKVMVNLAPDDPSLGVVIPPLKSMHGAEGCACETIPVAEMRINHYLGSTEDYLERTRRSWEEGYSQEKVEFFVADRDVNDETSDTITKWACATREVLFRVVEGIDLESGLE